ncbi:tRNA3(Ser)-specific nuclease WapA precursor [Pelotomaculum schinkii]|uniref:tRNA3(Ser)-specific nuclease WapA n=1 Tax=Pelotomaculum schinkii TaxID=78350 RepID=A0A4Y7RDA3_9FIRM|nr:S8 family serine peptidase [Pelotomaculum schinkii]TEB06806.1 tRNA3(Ser)-specific nuclease WapA precursor [Pelotomaculum schinkii]
MKNKRKWIKEGIKKSIVTLLALIILFSSIPYQVAYTQDIEETFPDSNKEILVNFPSESGKEQLTEAQIPNNSKETLLNYESENKKELSTGNMSSNANKDVLVNINENINKVTEENDNSTKYIGETIKNREKASFKSNEILVKYKNENTKEALKNNAKKNLNLNKLTTKKQFVKLQIDLLEIDKDSSIDSVIAELQKDPDIEYAQPNYTVSVLDSVYLDSNQDLLSLYEIGQVVEGQECIPGTAIDVLSAWKLTKGSPGMLVAVLDTGIDINHQELVNNIFANQAEIPGDGIDNDYNGYIDDVKGWDFANHDNSIYDTADEFHGTHISGIIAATENGSGVCGVAPGVKILPIKFINGSIGYTSDAIEAIEYAESMGARIINCSWGGSENNTALKDAIAQSNMVFVCAAGNDDSANPVYPAAFDLPNVISVGAVNQSGQKASFSNYGAYVDLAAPGVSIISTTPQDNYGYMGGTSMAAGFVSGAAALLLSYQTDLDAGQAVNRLKTCASPNETIKQFTSTGGIVNASAALTSTNVIGDIDNKNNAVNPDEVHSIIASYSSINQVTATQKEKILDFYHITEQQIIEAEQTGYSLTDSINIAKAATEYQFTINEVIIVLQKYGNILDAEAELSNFKHFSERYVVPVTKYGELKSYFLAGYTSNEIRSAYVASLVSNLSIANLLKIQNEDPLQTIINSLNMGLSQVQIDILNELFAEYDVNKRNLLIYMQQDNISAEQIKSLFEQLEQDILTQYINATGQTVNPYGTGENDQINYDKYFNAPYVSNIKDSENIELNTGALKLQNTELSLKGRNGLDLNITSQYDSSKANLYNVGYSTSVSFSYQVYVQEVRYIRYTDWSTSSETTSRPFCVGNFGSYSEASLCAYGYKFTLPESTGYIYDFITSSRYFNKTTSYQITYTGYYNGYFWSEYQSSYYSPPNSQFIYEDGYFGSIPLSYTQKTYDTGKMYSWDGKSYTQTVTYNANYRGELRKTTYERIGEGFKKYNAYVETSLPDIRFVNVTNSDTYNELHNNLGSGWSLGFPSVEIDMDNKYLHLSNGDAYKINITSATGDSNLEKYPLNDIIFDNDSGSYSNGVSTSSYVLTRKDGIKEYFSSDGRLLGIKDRFNNVIKFEHTSINGEMVINKITDTVGRIVNISYQDISSTSKKVVITAPDSSTIQFILESIPACHGEYKLVKKIDRLGRETTFNYNINSANFTFYKYSGEKVNKYANITEIHYPTGAYSKYTYEKARGVLGNHGSLEYYRIKTREDIENGKSYNNQTYSYINNFTGYPTCTDSNSLPTNFTYRVDVTDAYLTKTSHTFNSKHLEIRAESKANGTMLKTSIDVTYDANKLPVKGVSRVYNTNGQYMEKVENYSYDTNKYGDLLGFWDVQNSRNADNSPANDEHKTTYTYDPSYHLVTSKTYKKDAATTIQEVMTPYSNKKSIEWHKIYVNGLLKKQTRYIYDVYGNVIEEQKYLDNWTDYVSDKSSYDDNNPARHGQFNGLYLTRKWVEGVKNADGNLVDAKLGNSAGVIDEISKYDLMGNLLEKHDGVGNATSYQYDIVGRLLKETNCDGTFKSLSYNDAENSVVFTNEKGDSLKRDYDGFGNLIYEQDTSSGEMLKQFEYDQKFKLAKETGPNNKNTTSYSYNDEGKLLRKEVKDNSGALLAAESYIYENAFAAAKYNKITKNVQGDTNSPSQITTTYENKYGFTEKQGKMHDGKEYLDTFKYDYLGHKIEEKSARAYAESWTEPYTKKYQYDYAGNVVQEYNIKGDYITTAYDSLGRKIKVTDIKGNKSSTPYSTTYVYDNLGRLIKENIPFEDVNGTKYYTIKKHYYDRNKNITRESATINKPGGTEAYSRIDYQYNNLNRLVMVTTFNGATPVNYTQFYYDAAGNKIRMYTGLASPLTISGLDTVTANGDSDYSITKYSYDRFGNLTDMTDPAGQHETYRYDLSGNMIGQTDRNENIITISYDGLNRVLNKSVTTPDGLGNKSYSNTYTLTGSLLTTTGDKVNTTYAYDDLGRTKTETRTDGVTKTYTYDAGNNRTSVIIKKGGNQIQNTGYTYDKINRLYQVKDNGQVRATYAYDDNGNRQTLTYNNGNITEYHYNLANKIKTLTNKNGASILSQYTYNYYLDGNQADKTETVTNQSTEYLYDGLGRLQTETEKENGNVTSAVNYTYDDYNSRASMTKDGVTTSYNYDSNNRLVTEIKVTGDVTETTRYGYDNNGNQLYKTSETVKPATAGEAESISVSVSGVSGDGSVSFNEYDGFNQLVKVTSGDMTSTYEYNGAGLRNSKAVNGTVTTHIWDGNQIALELNGAGAVTNKYLLGINLISVQDGTGTTSYYLYNAHGDVVQLTNSSGAVTKTYTYDAFGNEKNPDPNDPNAFRYCGEYFDKETGTYYLRGRYYNPAIGRFISADSYLGKDNDPLSLNLYTYCANDPVNYNDPSGHFVFNALAAGIGAAIGGIFNTAFSVIGDLWTGDLQWNNWNSWQSHGREYGGAFITGAIGGAAAGLTGGLSLLAGVGINAGAWGIGSIAGGYVATGAFSWGQAGWSALGGGIGYGIGRYAGDYLGSALSRGYSSITSNSLSDTFNAGWIYKPSYNINLQQFANNEIRNFPNINGFNTFNNFKKAFGPAGDNLVWHHIVEQSQITKSGFSPTRIHNIENIIAVDRATHAKISGYYNSIDSFTNGMRIRNWLAGQSFEEQYKFGLDVLRRYGICP